MRSFSLPAFYPIVDTVMLEHAGLEALPAAESLVAAGAKILQYRHKAAWRQRDMDEARTIAEVCRGAGVEFVLNDRADFARVLGCGLHIGQDDLHSSAASKVLGLELPIGFSTHNREQIVEASAFDVQYLSLGPVFATGSKANPDPVVGIEGLAELRQLAKLPLCAIGGITIQQAEVVLRAGADSVAVISALTPPGVTYKDVRTIAEDWLRITKS